jgi:hypothetical protein
VDSGARGCASVDHSDFDFMFGLPMGNGQVLMNYSLDEQVVGTWIDGKPLYQKTYNFGAIPNNTSKTVSTGFRIDEVRFVELFGYAYRSSDSAGFYLPNGSLSVAVIGNNIAIFTKDDGNGMIDILISTKANLSTYTETFITLRYIKLTD